MKSLAEENKIPRTEVYIGTGDGAIYSTIDKMKEIIIGTSKNPYIRGWVDEILSGAKENDKTAEATAIFNFTRDNIRYVNDPAGWEYLQTPMFILEAIRLYQEGRVDMPEGDCDDFTMLALTLLKNAGFNVAIKVVSFFETKLFSHVYGMVQINGQWIAVDAIRKDGQLGKEHPGVTREKTTVV